MRIGLLITAALAASIPFATHAAEDISGTYKLVVDQRKIVETGEIIRGASPQGYISYGKDGRLFVIIVRQPRPRPENSDTVTDQQRIDLYRTMSAYGGTYKFDGTTVEHSIDIAWNEVWSGTTQKRTVTIEGDRLTLTTPSYQSQVDGKTSINILVWEKVK